MVSALPRNAEALGLRLAPWKAPSFHIVSLYFKLISGAPKMQYLVHVFPLFLV